MYVLHAVVKLLRQGVTKARGRVGSVTRRLPLWWPWVALPAGWATVVLALYVCFVAVWPFHGWSKSDQLALLQAMTAMAGFGAGTVALLIAARQIASGTKPELQVTAARPQGDEINVSGGAGIIEIHLSLENRGRIVTRVWQVRVIVLGPVLMRRRGTLYDAIDILEANTQGFLCSRETPLFPNVSVPVGTVTIEAQRGELPRDEANRGVMFGVHVFTEYGPAGHVFVPLKIVDASAP